MTAEELESLAATAKRLKAGANEREGHSLKELIELDRYLAEKAAPRGTGVMVLTKLRMGGATV